MFTMDFQVKMQIVMDLHAMGSCAVIGILLLFSKQKIYRGGEILALGIFVNMFLLLFDAISGFSNGSENIWGAILIRVSVFGIFFLEYMLIAIFTLYVYVIIRTVNPKYPDTCKYIIWGIVALEMLLLCLTPFLGIYYTIDDMNVYHREKFWVFSLILASLVFCVIGFILYQNWRCLKSERYEIITFLICPILGSIIQFYYYRYSFEIWGITISVVIAFVFYMFRRRKWAAERELVLLQSQAYLMNSQIKPHFLFNSLNIIQSLIEEDPDTAIKAVNHFSKYLRTGLRMEVMNHMIPLKQELEYVDNYLYLEQLRYGDKLQIVKNIQPGMDFEIPFLTIQPIVENAVRHGVRKRLKGGTVVIDIRRVLADYVICIQDDGIGYLPIQKEEKEWNPSKVTASGVGTNNVRNRLSMMCNGTMEIDSEPGKGTKVTIRIPVN